MRVRTSRLMRQKALAPMLFAATLLVMATAICQLVVYGQRVTSPGEVVWILSRQTAGNERLTMVRPEVHEVRKLEDEVEISSAGISLYYFGPLQSPVEQVERIRQLRFRIPLNPALAALEMEEPTSVRPDVTGLFINGAPIFNLIGKSGRTSYRGQNLWHFDPLAMNDDGSRVAGGWPRPSLTHKTPLGLLEAMISDSSHHSPLIGFAFDGFPIYGPWGYTNSDGTGGLRRQRSSYQRRRITRRNELPDGARLEPGQEGPAVSEEAPLGSFIEDFKYVAGTGDLDQFNGRWTVTPEYPAGTYAYFATTDEAGRLAFPYLLSSHYRGRLSGRQLNRAYFDVSGIAGGASLASELIGMTPGNPTRQARWREIPSLPAPAKFRLSLEVVEERLSAGQPIGLSFRVRGGDGKVIRYLENVHERPLHLLVVAEDLEDFDHIHPELAPGDRYEVTHRFPHNGRYRLYADFTPPGGRQQVVSFILDIGLDIGRQTAAAPPAGDSKLVGEREPSPDGLISPVRRQVMARGLNLTLASGRPLHAGEENGLSLRIRDGAGQMPENLEPFLGAWAHFVIIDPAHRHFIHAHPIEDGAGQITGNVAASPPIAHYHEPAIPGPPPEEIRTLVVFPQPGRYRMWAQFQVAGELVTQHFDLEVAPTSENGISHLAQGSRELQTEATPADVIRISVGSRGFTPAEIAVKTGQPVRLLFEREVEPNCASEILFPQLGIRQRLPLGGRMTIELPATRSETLSFSCGMGMYKGLVVSTK